MPAVTVCVPPTARANWMDSSVRAQRRGTGAEHVLAGDVLAHSGHATGARDAVGRARRPRGDGHRAREVVDAAAPDPAAGREFTERSLTVVAPGLAARDGQQYRAGHHLRVDAGHQPKRRAERRRLAVVTGRARAVVAQLDVAGLVVRVHRRRVHVADAAVVEAEHLAHARSPAEALSAIDGPWNLESDIGLKLHRAGGVVDAADDDAGAKDIACAIVAGVLRGIDEIPQTQSHRLDLLQRVDTQHRRVGQGVPLDLQRTRLDGAQSRSHRHVALAIARGVREAVFLLGARDVVHRQ